MSIIFIVLQVQLSPFSPHNSPLPHRSLPPTLSPTPLWLCPRVLYTSFLKEKMAWSFLNGRAVFTIGKKTFLLLPCSPRPVLLFLPDTDSFGSLFPYPTNLKRIGCEEAMLPSLQCPPQTLALVLIRTLSAFFSAVT